jgi:hypothetical protein
VPSNASGFLNLSAPEIRAFVDGNDQPPLSPRLDGSPALTYTWLDRRTGKTLRTGRTYRIRRGDKGRELACAVTAANAGGTITRTPTSGIRVSRSVMYLLRRERRKAVRACARKRSKAAEARCRSAVKRRYG